MYITNKIALSNISVFKEDDLFYPLDALKMHIEETGQITALLLDNR